MNPTEDWLLQPDGLATRLRAIRTQAGLSGKELAAATGWQPSKVSRLENGKQMPTVDDVRTWVDVTEARDQLSDLIDLVGAGQSVHLDWKRRYRRGQAAVQANYNQLVQESTVVRHFETVFVPGLLQTSEYARIVLGRIAGPHNLGAEDLDAAVSTRLERQQMLYDRSKRFEFLLAEPVLRWLICPADVMRSQLDRLSTATTLPNVRFGILPMGVELSTIPQNSFQMYDGLAIVETFVGETTHQTADSDAYLEAFEQMWADAFTGANARAAIVQAVAALPA